MVLEFGRFQHWDQLSYRSLTLKTVFLLALATGKRKCEIHPLSQDVRWINGDVRRVEIAPVPYFMSKTRVITSNIEALRPTLSEFDEIEDVEANKDHLMCPARTLECNMKRSTKCRSPDQKILLFLHYFFPEGNYS